MNRFQAEPQARQNALAVSALECHPSGLKGFNDLPALTDVQRNRPYRPEIQRPMQTSVGSNTLTELEPLFA
jgi:hypothetical protein